MKNSKENETSVSRAAEGERLDNPVPTIRERIRSWTCNQFAITNADGDTVALLRSLADQLEQIGAIHILDITYSANSDPSIDEITASVYFTFPEDD